MLSAKARIRRLERRLKKRGVKGPGDYPDDPVGYATHILGVQVTPDQADILRALLKPPYRVLVKAGHSVGKTFLAAIAVCWWYDSFDPGVAISTAPDFRAVNELLWKEIRVLRRKAKLGGLMPAAPEMRSAPDHYAKGFTARQGDSFQGRHDKHMLFVFDEATGVDPVFWETTATMFRPAPGHAWLAIFNPTKTNSQAYIEDKATNSDGSPKWKSYTLDCLNHPNVKGKGPNDPLEIPAAVTWQQVDDWVQSWCERIAPNEANPIVDLEWPAGSGKWWKQGVIFLIRCRGLWPSGAMESVWSEHLWSLIELRKDDKPPLDLLPEIGCDVARFGDDYTAIHVRWGSTSYYHESKSKQDTHKTRMRLQEIADEWAIKATRYRDKAAKPISKNQIVIKVDDDGLGGGLVDELMAHGYHAVGVGAGTKSISGRYPNKRSELWFQVADRASGGWIGLGLIDKVHRDRMRQQALAVTWMSNAAGMRVVEPKEFTKEMIGRSPDDMDAVNLAYLEGWDMGTAKFIEGNQKREVWTAAESKPKRGIWGV